MKLDVYGIDILEGKVWDRVVPVIVGQVGPHEGEVALEEGGDFIAYPAMASAREDKGHFQLGMEVPEAAEILAPDATAGHDFGGVRVGQLFADGFHGFGAAGRSMWFSKAALI